MSISSAKYLIQVIDQAGNSAQVTITAKTTVPDPTVTFTLGYPNIEIKGTAEP